MSTKKDDKKKDWNGGVYNADISRSTADFQCAVCGAIFSTDQDRKQHLEKEAHGELREDTTPEEMEIAKECPCVCYYFNYVHIDLFQILY